MTLYCLLSGGVIPFDSPYEELTFHRILNDPLELVPQITKKYSTAAQNLLMMLLRRKTEDRLTAKAALEHPWIAENGQCANMPVPPVEDPTIISMAWI